jgi:hypothetical protein
MIIFNQMFNSISNFDQLKVLLNIPVFRIINGKWNSFKTNSIFYAEDYLNSKEIELKSSL